MIFHRGKGQWFGLFWAGLLLLAGCSNGSSEGAPRVRERPAVPVTAAVVATKDVPIQLTAVGAVEAYATVSLKSRVSGELLAVHFQEGQEVQEGDLLFTIDPAPYQAALREAQAKLAGDQVMARKARDDVRRNAPLAEKNVVSSQNYEQVRATAESLQAAVKADQAALDNLALQLSYCSIRAPISGRTGSLLSHKGNLVKANDDNKSLVVINQIQPIFINFALPEKYLDQINRASRTTRLLVEARLPEAPSDAGPLPGELSFVDNAVDAGSGTISLKGVFPNQDRRLWPGQAVNVVLTLGVQAGAVVTPSQAIQDGQSGQYAFVIQPQGTVEMRPVKVSRDSGGEAVIAEGLKPGETVVTDGQLLLTPGARVKIKEAAGQGDRKQ